MARCSAVCSCTRRRWIAISAGLASGGGRNSAKGSAAPLKLARSRAISSCCAIRSLLQVFAVGIVHRRIELDQHVTGLDALAILHVDRANNARSRTAGSPWCGHSARSCRARRRRYRPARAGPGQRQQNSAMMRQRQSARPTGEGGVFDDLQRRRKESEFVPSRRSGACGKATTVVSGLHGCPPASGAASHSGRRCGSSSSWRAVLHHPAALDGDDPVGMRARWTDGGR